jgi:WD40 repeat protein
VPNHHPVCLAEVTTGKLVRELTMPTSNAGPVAFSPDGKRLAVAMGSADGQIRLLDVATGETLSTLSSFGSRAQAMTFSPDGKYLIGALRDQTSLVWDLARALKSKAKEER